MIVIGVGNSSCGNVSDPINLVFRGLVNLSGIVNALRGVGWSHPSRVRGHFAVPLFLCDKSQQNPEPQHEQVVNGQPWDRYHVRLWDVARLPGGTNYERVITNSSVVAAAHHEIFVFPGVHRVTAYESGKWKITYDLSQVPGWSVQPDSEYTGNFNLVPFSNDYATVVS